MNATDPLEPGQRYGLSGAGWPPATIERDSDGLYYIERLSDDLRRIVREEITAEDARGWIEQDESVR